jgi:hypothetical protein
LLTSFLVHDFLSFDISLLVCLDPAQVPLNNSTAYLLLKN